MSIIDSSNGFGKEPENKNISLQLLIVAIIAVITAFFVGKRLGAITTAQPLTPPTASVQSVTPISKPYSEVTVSGDKVLKVVFPIEATLDGHIRYETMTSVTLPNGLICTTYYEGSGSAISCVNNKGVQ